MMEPEWAAAEKRVRRLIDQRTDEALARLDGVTVEEYRERRRLVRLAEQRQRTQSSMEALGVSIARFNAALVDAAISFARGYAAGARGTVLERHLPKEHR